ncbi:hypothetical protein MKW98_009488 [Papaver atlanticum]|uniref:Uncharacterized protein n=1 Tax=Papaver atlanticum TaxID=357466 RepID=A0AAD4SJ56_9MAGN|nr:hypothetical protein MKW98_009488 [Papaver atlanticum]
MILFSKILPIICFRRRDRPFTILQTVVVRWTVREYIIGPRIWEAGRSYWCIAKAQALAASKIIYMLMSNVGYSQTHGYANRTHEEQRNLRLKLDLEPEKCCNMTV